MLPFNRSTKNYVLFSLGVSLFLAACEPRAPKAVSQPPKKPSDNTTTNRDPITPSTGGSGWDGGSDNSTIPNGNNGGSNNLGNGGSNFPGIGGGNNWGGGGGLPPIIGDSGNNGINGGGGLPPSLGNGGGINGGSGGGLPPNTIIGDNGNSGGNNQINDNGGGSGQGINSIGGSSQLGIQVVLGDGSTSQIQWDGSNDSFPDGLSIIDIP